MSLHNLRLRLSVLRPPALAEAIAIGNPLQLAPSWTPVDSEGHSRSDVVLAAWGCSDEPCDRGEVSFVIDPDPTVFGTGAAVSICYLRNKDVAECAENTALDGSGTALDNDTIQLILDRIQPKLLVLEPRDVAKLSDPLQTRRGLGIIAASFEREFAQHVGGEVHPCAPHISLVKAASDTVSDDARVFKRCTYGCELVKDLEFATRLPEVDFLLRPTHLVVDEAGLLHGMLSDSHPASSLSITMKRLHPLAVGCRRWPPAITPSVSWSVKLGWATDVAAAVAWLHAHSIVWGDLKTDNVVLCKDGHCRLIDYIPGGYTLGWCPPEAKATLPLWVGSVEGDIFDLALVLWCLATEVPTVDTGEEENVRLPLEWTAGTPEWLQTLVSSCIEDDPACRPSARHVYETLVAAASDDV
ncbi:kinase-like domain-containing protein [Mycena galericulata]|nr:kinase-like domain-containing protein [Mycena galericulata]